MFVQLTFCPRMPHNETLVSKPLQRVSMWFPDRNTKKESLRTIQCEYGFFLVLKKGLRQKNKIQKSLHFFSQKRFFADLRSSKLIISKLLL